MTLTSFACLTRVIDGAILSTKNKGGREAKGAVRQRVQVLDGLD